MNKTILSFFLLLSTVHCKSQGPGPKDSITQKIVRLDNMSVKVTQGYFLRLQLDDKARTACNNLTYEGVKVLLEGLNDTARAVVAHLILTANFSIKPSPFGYLYEYQNDRIVKTKFTFNNFSWTQSKDGTIEIEDSEIAKIRNYWEQIVGRQKILLHNCDLK